MGKQTSVSKVLLLLFLVVLFSGCIGTSGTSGYFSVTGTVASSGIPITEVEVTVVDRGAASLTSLGDGTATKAPIITKTDRNGRFRIDSITSGRYEFIARKHGFNPVSVIRDVNNRNRDISIEIQNILEILWVSEGNYQFSAQVYPQDINAISDVTITTPSGTRELERDILFGHELYHKFWSAITVPAGEWKLDIRGPNLHLEPQVFYVEPALLPSRPVLVHPIGGEKIENATPIFSYTFDWESVDRIHVRLYEVQENGGVDWDSPMVFPLPQKRKSYQIPPGILEAGKRYAWQVIVIRGTDIPLRYEALSDLEHFLSY